MFAQPVDLMPTLFDLSGVSAAGTVAPPQPLHGHSLAPVLRGHDGGWRDATLSGSFPGEIAPGDEWPRGTNTPFVITEDYGYAPIGENGTVQLFDLAADPLAERPLGADSGALEAGHARLSDLLQQIESPQLLLEFFDRRLRPGRS